MLIGETTVERGWGSPDDAPESRRVMAPSQLHRGLALIATMSLFIGTRSSWTDALTSRPIVMAILSACYLAILAVAVLGLIVRTRRALIRVDVLILGLASALVIGGVILQHKPSDEGTLVAQAARTLLHGGQIYGVAWPQLFSQEKIPVTWMMNGGADYTFGYPPLAALLTAPALLFASFPSADSFMTTLVLLIGAVVMWCMLPVDWRSGGTAVMLGLPFLPHYARLGYPAVIAMVFLIPVVIRWPTIGLGGRLSRGDVLRAACLGAACATQQLAWFVAPFLIVGLFALRRGELSTRRAALTVASFAGVAAAVWVAINAPFIIRDAPAWAAGVTLVLTQHAIPHGQGLIGVSFYLTDGSGALDYYSYATLSLTVGLVLLSAVWVRRLGPALTVIPWIVFFLSVRSQDGYFLMMIPLWLAAAATAPPSAFATAWQPRLPRLSATSRAWSSGWRWAGGTPARVALAGMVLMPSLIFATVAMASDEPLDMTILATTSLRAHDQGLWRMEVQVENTSKVALDPHFTISRGQGITPFWTATGGPAELAAGATATYELTAAVPSGYMPGLNDYFVLRALTDRPMTVSTIQIPIGP
jgi:hypothetical protein